MKRFTLLGFLFLVYTLQAQNLIAVQNGDDPEFYTFLDDAITFANIGDTIYLPGGSFPISIYIDKELHIIGAGGNSDSSFVTGITLISPFTIIQGASNGSLEGVDFVPTTSSVGPSITFNATEEITDYNISRCNLTNGISFITECSNLIIKNCIIGGWSNYVYGYNYGSLNGLVNNSGVYNNIILNFVSLQDNNLFRNNNFYYIPSGYGLYGSARSSYSLYENNIFLDAAGSNACNYSTFNNNINASPSITYSNTGNNNYDETFDLIFVDPGEIYLGYYPYDPLNDYHLLNTSLANNSGTDGTDMGIYGGAFPWKDGSIPKNPHIYFKDINATTSDDGTLDINIKVNAQDN